MSPATARDRIDGTRLSHSMSHPSLPTSETSIQPLPSTAPIWPTHSDSVTAIDQVSSPTISTPSSSSRTSHQPFPPYLHQSTQSPLVTRSTSSPSHPVGHRVSRSVGSLPFVGTPGKESEEYRRRSLEASLSTNKEPNLPTSPHLWTPSELAQYLAYALRSGGADRCGPILPVPVIEDIVRWVLRGQVSGRAFLRGVEGWSGTRPPPFLPVLTSLSRRLRRTSRQGRPSDPLSGDLMEEDESTGHDDAETVTRVRRLAHAFDTIGSASETSGDEGAPALEALRAQLTGESVGGFGRATPRIGRDAHAAWSTKKRRESGLSPSGLVDAESPLRTKGAGSAVLEPTLKAKSSDIQSDGADGARTSPPPPYASPDPDTAHPSSPMTGMLFAVRESPSPPLSGFPIDRADPETTLSNDVVDKSNQTNKPLSPHMLRMRGHQISGINPYAALRRSSSGSTGPRLPTLNSLKQVDVNTDSDNSEEPPIATSDGTKQWDDALDATRWSTARRVTLRTNKIEGVFRTPSPGPATSSSLASTHTTPGSKRRTRTRERELDREVASLTDRIRDLENRLAAVESVPSSPAPLPSSLVPSTSKVKSWLTAVGLTSQNSGSVSNDALPTRLRELPGYLFLVGVGVGAVMMRVFMGKMMRP